MKWNGYEGSDGLLANITDAGASSEELAHVRQALSSYVKVKDFVDFVMHQHATNIRIAAAIVAVASSDPEKLTPALEALVNGIDQQGNHMISTLKRTLSQSARVDGN
jgi:hypothetical protein